MLTFLFFTGGNGVVFMKGNDYLLQNLIESTLWAIGLICIVMATQFFDARMILISTIPRIIDFYDLKNNL